MDRLTEIESRATDTVASVWYTSGCDLWLCSDNGRAARGIFESRVPVITPADVVAGAFSFSSLAGESSEEAIREAEDAAATAANADSTLRFSERRKRSGSCAWTFAG
jgi:hypothetical protein